MKKKNKLQLTKEQKENMTYQIKAYFSNERDEEIGDLGASMLLDFFIEEFAYEFYNKGIDDAYVYMLDKCEDILSLQR